MEPITAVLKIVGAYGVMSLVKALGGNDQLAQMSRELFQALDESESRIDARLSGIESLLDQILEPSRQPCLGPAMSSIYRDRTCLGPTRV